MQASMQRWDWTKFCLWTVQQPYSISTLLVVMLQCPPVVHTAGCYHWDKDSHTWFNKSLTKDCLASTSEYWTVDIVILRWNQEGYTTHWPVKQQVNVPQLAICTTSSDSEGKWHWLGIRTCGSVLSSPSWPYSLLPQANTVPSSVEKEHYILHISNTLYWYLQEQNSYPRKCQFVRSSCFECPQQQEWSCSEWLHHQCLNTTNLANFY